MLHAGLRLPCLRAQLDDTSAVTPKYAYWNVDTNNGWCHLNNW